MILLFKEKDIFELHLSDFEDFYSWNEAVKYATCIKRIECPFPAKFIYNGKGINPTVEFHPETDVLTLHELKSIVGR